MAGLVCSCQKQFIT